MIRQKISDIIAKGTAREKVNLLAEHSAGETMGEGGTLSKQEAEALRDSLRKPAEVRLYEKMKDVDNTLYIGIQNFKQLQYVYELHIAGLSFNCYTWDQYRMLETFFNTAVSKLKTQADKQIFTKLLQDDNPLFYARIEVAQDGYIDVNIEPSKERKGRYLKEGEEVKADLRDRASLRWAINWYQEKAVADLKEAKAQGKVLLDIMARYKFNFKAYQTIINRIMAELLRDRAYKEQYSKRWLESLDWKSEAEKAEALEEFKQFWVFPDPTIEPDQERIDYYRYEILRDNV